MFDLPDIKVDPFILDYDTIKQHYSFQDASELFERALKREVAQNYEDFFALVFKIGNDGTFPINGENCLLIKKDGELFLLSEDSQIIYWISTGTSAASIKA